ncbi:MAG: DUF2147 domain-containing protein [Rhodoferax sp.]|uniref:DUF2147 domain-containing protein n=1 Tax=Rhodoferax sp. TaxID=50421 RepID=UPI0026305295|nr:DUF2147 domain-containing protein [Rhodoferax sp.]MDD5333362.1 DUF2147 domain-containing protein [Rhodoferax sp.]
MKTTRSVIRAALAVVALCVVAGAQAQMTPVGNWHSIDDKTGEIKSQIQISESDGVVSGRIDKLLRKEADQKAVCKECTDDRKDKPLLGLEIIRGAKKVDGKDVWEGGHIVDPDSGTIYKLKMTPVEGGKKLEVRGFIGFALLGRTQTWVRVP